VGAFLLGLLGHAEDFAVELAHMLNEGSTVTNQRAFNSEHEGTSLLIEAVAATSSIEEIIPLRGVLDNNLD